MKKTRKKIFETMQRVFKKKDSETCIHYEPVKMKKDPRPGEEVGEGWVSFDNEKQE